MDLPKELSITEAAEALGVSPKTIRAYLREGSLVARNIAPLSSTHKRLRIPLDAVLAMRGAYESQAVPRRPARVVRRVKAAPFVPRHII